MPDQIPLKHVFSARIESTPDTFLNWLKVRYERGLRPDPKRGWSTIDDRYEEGGVEFYAVQQTGPLVDKQGQAVAHYDPSDNEQHNLVEGVQIGALKLGDNRTLVEVGWNGLDDYAAAVLREIAANWPDAKHAIDACLKALGIEGPAAEPKQAPSGGDGQRPSKQLGKLGHHGGTMDRVKEAWKLVEGGEHKTTACKRVGIDIRTYDRYVLDITCPEKEPDPESQEARSDWR